MELTDQEQLGGSGAGDTVGTGFPAGSAKTVNVKGLCIKDATNVRGLLLHHTPLLL